MLRLPQQATDPRDRATPTPITWDADHYYCVEAEVSALGSMLASTEVALEMADVLTAQDFYRDSHQRLFTVLAAMVDDGLPMDFVLVMERLGGGETWEDELLRLMEYCPSPANASFYAGIVKERANRRRFRDECATLLEACERLDFADMQKRLREWGRRLWPRE